MYQIYDANGNAVESMAHCNRCGCPIKHVYEFNGLPYGSTCIESVSGIHPDNWVFSGGRYDHTATKLSLSEKEAKRQAAAAKEAARIAKVETIRKVNTERYAELINVLENSSKYSGDFCSEMAASIKFAMHDTELDGIFRGRAYGIVRDIWAKSTGGRKASKAYNDALETFERM